jgi:hypothetical protein
VAGFGRMDTLKYMAAKVGTNLLTVNTPLCTTNEIQKIKVVIIRFLQNYISKRRVFLLNFYPKKSKI